MKTEEGTIVVEVWKWSSIEEKSILYKTDRRSCRKTVKRFILSKPFDRKQFDLEGNCVALQGINYQYRILPETFRAGD